MCCKNCGKEKYTLQGNASDLFLVDETNNYQSIKLVDDIDDNYSVTLELTSVDPSGRHPLIDKYLGKKIEISIKILDEE